MLLNANTKLVGDRVTLVPYRPEHVEKYHTWMQDPTIQQQTASEPLSLQQEYAMCESWLQDDDKLTFIILYENVMIGDVNLFLSPDELSESAGKRRGELEIMIAEPEYRRRRLAYEALGMLIDYAADKLDMARGDFFCKIGASNQSSIALFEKLGFYKAKYSQVFDEWEMKIEVGNEFSYTQYSTELFTASLPAFPTRQML